MAVREDELISRRLKICENCDWGVPTQQMPRCLLKGQQTGIFEYCDRFKKRTGNHISM